MTEAKQNRRAMRQQLLRQAIDGLQATAFGKGVQGFCGGARPAQVKAAARVHVDGLMKRMRAV